MTADPSEPKPGESRQTFPWLFSFLEGVTKYINAWNTWLQLLRGIPAWTLTKEELIEKKMLSAWEFAISQTAVALLSGTAALYLIKLTRPTWKVETPDTLFLTALMPVILTASVLMTTYALTGRELELGREPDALSRAYLYLNAYYGLFFQPPSLILLIWFIFSAANNGVSISPLYFMLLISNIVLLYIVLFRLPFRIISLARTNRWIEEGCGKTKLWLRYVAFTVAGAGAVADASTFCVVRIGWVKDAMGRIFSLLSLLVVPQ